MMYSGRQYVILYTVFLGSMFAGASLVHNVLKPDLTLPALPVVNPAASQAASTASLPTVVGAEQPNSTEAGSPAGSSESPLR